MDTVSTLQSLGLELPSPAYLFGTLVFGLLGFWAYRRGRKLGLGRTKWLGIALMLYPYVVSPTWLLYAVGIALCVGVYADRQDDGDR